MADVAEDEKDRVLGYLCVTFCSFGGFCVLGNSVVFKSCSKLPSALGQTVQNHLFPLEEPCYHYGPCSCRSTRHCEVLEGCSDCV